jgi:hypothetical protein
MGNSKIGKTPYVSQTGCGQFCIAIPFLIVNPIQPESFSSNLSAQWIDSYNGAAKLDNLFSTGLYTKSTSL